MAVQIESSGDTTVVIAEGMFKGGPDTEELHETITRLMVEDGCTKLILDVTGVTFLGSPSIGVIGAAHGHARDHNVEFWICGMNERVQSVFKLMKFGPELRTFETRDAALSAMGQG